MSNIQDKLEEKNNESVALQNVGNIIRESISSPISENDERATVLVHPAEVTEDVCRECEYSKDITCASILHTPEVSQSANSAEVFPPVTSNGNWEDVKTYLEYLHSELADLKNSFDIKLKYDQHKEIVIDRQNKELEDYRSGLIDKVSLQIANDVIQQIDDIEKLSEHYPPFPQREDDGLCDKYEKLRKLFLDISESLRDMLGKNDIESYKEGEAGQLFNPKRQRVLKKEVTCDKTLDKRVKRSLRWGFSFNGKVIRPEIVEVYIWQPQQPSIATESAEALPQDLVET